MKHLLNIALALLAGLTALAQGRHITPVGGGAATPAAVVAAPHAAAPGDTAVSQQPDTRHVTPVRPSTNTVLRPAPGTDEEVIQNYLKGDTTSALAKLRKDSLARIYPHYPALTSLRVSVGVLDPVLQLFGQKYGSVDVGLTLNLWNRLQPVVELGLGRASDTPDDMNFTYKGKLSPYARVGANYNFLFKKVPDYQVYLGVRAGYSTFKYDITDVHIDPGYWQENADFDLKGEKSHALWGEVAAGISVKVWRQFSAGWEVKYQAIFNYKKNDHSRPWFVPGFGPRDRHWGFAFKLSYTLPLSRDRWPKPEETDKKKTR